MLHVRNPERHLRSQLGFDIYMSSVNLKMGYQIHERRSWQFSGESLLNGKDQYDLLVLVGSADLNIFVLNNLTKTFALSLPML
jgi:hypothetical protein